jgi:hypothetical protein
VTLLLLACTDPVTIHADDPGGDTAPVADTGTDTGTDTGEPARDLDGDGYPAGEDCMDLNAEVHPDATEVWNGLDDDCDGVFDADGAWSGELSVAAQAIYEGRRYTFSLRCPVAGNRASGAFDWLATCTPDADDEDAMRLLGATLTLRPDDAAVELDAWEGTVVVESSNGWDTDADGTIAWSTFDRAELQASLSAASLTLTASGPLDRQ